MSAGRANRSGGGVVCEEHGTAESSVGGGGLRAVGPGPWGEPARLAVVAFVRERDLRTDAQNALIVNPRPTVVPDGSVDDGDADVEQHVLRSGVHNHIRQHLPRVVDGVGLEKVILATITTKLSSENNQKKEIASQIEDE